MGLERNDKIIASQGRYTRKEIKKLAAVGKITVNGQCANADDKADPETDEITVEGISLSFRRHIYLLVNKPIGYTSVTEGSHHDCVTELIPDDLARESLMPAGRLDRDASGMMIITDDGELAHNILSPNRQIKKIYDIVLDEPVTEKTAAAFASGIRLGSEIKKAVLTVTGEKTCRVMTRDARYFQLRQMLESCGKKVIAMHRVGIGDLLLPGDMRPGACRELTKEELQLLQER